MSRKPSPYTRANKTRTNNISNNNNNTNNCPTSPSSNDSDEQLARDMQLAFELQAREEQRARKYQQYRQQKQQKQGSSFAIANNLSPDHMLFVSCTLDGIHDVKLLIDTGASSSAMSLDMVQSLGLLPKLNRGITGSAQGVGSSQIVGIVENVELFINHVEFRLYFMVIDTTMPCCILGLDQLRKYKCQVDLDSDELVFGGKGGVSVPFLPQEEARLVAQQMIVAGSIASSPPPPPTTTTTALTRQPDEADTIQGKIKSLFKF
ncbi:aspartyl protease [Nitzschia inconspicua]|uniref:Aspartyl protease n=1 Tax=Nitzschia inconspicua TaxID=303405 RepID=A0A9K3LAL0_9STRA|nr:aspartyl protease [Nitzschia inconspicua]